MTLFCCDCRCLTDVLEDGRYCPNCDSGVLREPRDSELPQPEGEQPSDAS